MSSKIKIAIPIGMWVSVVGAIITVAVYVTRIENIAESSLAQTQKVSLNIERKLDEHSGRIGKLEERSHLLTKVKTTLDLLSTTLTKLVDKVDELSKSQERLATKLLLTDRQLREAKDEADAWKALLEIREHGPKPNP